MTGWFIFWVIYIVCGVLAYGFTFAYLQKKCSFSAKDMVKSDRVVASIIGANGPVGLLVIWSCGYTTHGLMFKVAKND